MDYMLRILEDGQKQGNEMRLTSVSRRSLLALGGVWYVVLTERGRDQGAGTPPPLSFTRGQVYFNGDVRWMAVSGFATSSAVRSDQAMGFSCAMRLHQRVRRCSSQIISAAARCAYLSESFVVVRHPSVVRRILRNLVLKQGCSYQCFSALYLGTRTIGHRLNFLIIIFMLPSG